MALSAFSVIFSRREPFFLPLSFGRPLKQTGPITKTRGLERGGYPDV